MQGLRSEHAFRSAHHPHPLLPTFDRLASAWELSGMSREDISAARSETKRGPGAASMPKVQALALPRWCLAARLSMDMSAAGTADTGADLAEEGVPAGRLETVGGGGGPQHGARLAAGGFHLGPVLLIAGLDAPAAPGLHLCSQAEV